MVLVFRSFSGRVNACLFVFSFCMSVGTGLFVPVIFIVVADADTYNLTYISSSIGI